MAAGNQSEPNSTAWFSFGGIYEQFGSNDAAIAAYREVTPPEGPINPIDTYNLAQTRFKGLSARTEGDGFSRQNSISARYQWLSGPEGNHKALAARSMIVGTFVGV